MQSDPRAVLGLPVDATRGEAQRAFRRLAKETHPDAGGDPAAFRAVASAWADLEAVLPRQSRRPARSPYTESCGIPDGRVIWAEPRRPIGRKAARRDFGSILQAEMARLAA